MNIKKALAAVNASLTVACAWAEAETVGDVSECQRHGGDYGIIREYR